MKKITIKSTTMKEKLCKTCGLQKTCRDMSGFCVLIYFVPIALAVAGLVYLIMTLRM